jgi:hypothetical protein
MLLQFKRDRGGAQNCAGQQIKNLVRATVSQNRKKQIVRRFFVTTDRKHVEIIAEYTPTNIFI